MRLELVAFAAALALPSAAAPATTLLPAGPGHELVFVHPESWQAQPSGGAHGSAVSFVPADRGDFRVVVQAMALVEGQPATDADLEAGVRRSGEALLPTAQQSALEITRVAGEQASGFLYHLTDRQAERGPGDYRELRGGALRVGPYFLSVEILTHSDDPQTVADALATLGRVVYRAIPAPAGAEPRKPR